jgi:hypothetical protein
LQWCILTWPSSEMASYERVIIPITLGHQNNTSLRSTDNQKPPNSSPFSSTSIDLYLPLVHPRLPPHFQVSATLLRLLASYGRFVVSAPSYLWMGIFLSIGGLITMHLVCTFLLHGWPIGHDGELQRFDWWGLISYIYILSFLRTIHPMHGLCRSEWSNTIHAKSNRKRCVGM